MLLIKYDIVFENKQNELAYDTVNTSLWSMEHVNQFKYKMALISQLTF